ncbi:MAG: hypothetical protein ACE5L6_06195 [Candidatus Bathyarchaeia archaeon]
MHTCFASYHHSDKNEVDRFKRAVKEDRRARREAPKEAENLKANYLNGWLNFEKEEN